MNRNHQILDIYGNVLQRMPDGTWFVVKSSDTVEAEQMDRPDGVIWHKPVISDRALDWFFLACVVSLGAIGVVAVLS